jgi:formiminoglutamate deiminase
VTAYWCELLVDELGTHERVRFELDDGGHVAARRSGAVPQIGDQRLGTVLPGFADAHSHLFHRVLRGRTHDAGGDFWAWRERMYRAAAALDPHRYRRLAVAVFGEMIASGYTAVGEFHYLHHRPGGEPYGDHDMEVALAEAAAETGIRLTLLDTLYLTGGIGEPLSPRQSRFGDGSAERWLERWRALRDRLAVGHPGVVLGAALHSVRAVPPEAMALVAAELPADVPLHVHLSEQPLENEQCLARYGMTPTELLASAGVLGRRLSVVHATHLKDSDITLLGDAGVSVVMCPSTEADLGDGIGPALRLFEAGARVALGSDQNAVIDPFLEMRGLEAGERLASGRRGRFAPASLLAAGARAGYVSLGLGGSSGSSGPSSSHEVSLQPGDLFDVVELRSDSPRTAGAEPSQLVLAATAADVVSVHVGGRRVHHRSEQREEALGAALAAIIADVDAAGESETETHTETEGV